ncbi:hypothetical protein KFK09_001757 [Dendrobium nobile]|uniref:Endonuclease/exonuclease/phosphatase domain-containing protein n=1 Tax=Dendrobium nobile TaxID=94219 RepID=A0A8T3C5V8_DENNO|nr:hypothetical protein KFK09_001757 [Dendrobium nobile]
MSSILIWNCRGARKKQTGHYLRSLVGINEVCFVGLVETMVMDMSRMEVDRLIGSEWEFFHFPANGRSGGLIALWKRDVSKFEVLGNMKQVLIGSLIFPNMQRWIIVVVYASKGYHSRCLLWNTISPLNSLDLPVIVGGDFNCCLNQSEKKGGRRYNFSVGAQEMSEFMVDSDLHDLGFLGPKYTWSNNKSGHSKIWVRLDRILMNSEGLRRAPLAMVKQLVRLTSDHCPLLLNLFAEIPRPGNRWIRFEEIWMTYPITWSLGGWFGRTGPRRIMECLMRW